MANQFLDILKPSTKPSIQQLQEEARIARQEAEQANSFKGILTNTIKSIPQVITSIPSKIKQSIAPKKAMEFRVGEGLNQEQTDNAFKAILKPDVSQNPSFMSKGYYDPIAPSFSNKISTSQSILLSPSSSREEKLQAMEELANPAIGASTGLTKTSKLITNNIPESAFKYFAKEKNPLILEKDLVKIGLDEQNSKALSKELALTKTPKQAKDVVANYKPATNEFKNILTGEKAPEAYKETGDLTTKILKDLEGKSTVSKQYIQDATNRPELKQTERDIIREALQDEGDVINVSAFAKKVQSELLPLKVKGGEIMSVDEATRKIQEANQNKDYEEAERLTEIMERSDLDGGTKYESVALPDDLRGNIKNYRENIYESPVKTNAGNVHFRGVDNYFGHTRVEDMADNTTRRVIEVQSDLYQKGGLSKEAAHLDYFKSGEVVDYKGEPRKVVTSLNGRQFVQLEGIKGDIPITEIQRSAELTKPLAKLQQYNDPTAHFRMIREEIKKASQDDIKRLLFPTGETAMKIEGLGYNTQWNIADTGRNPINGRLPSGGRLTVENLKVGNEVIQNGGDNWIITDVLGDGKFKAVQKDRYELKPKGMDEQEIANMIENHKETFDISGKVDTNNPIYKFYEKEVARYLNKFGGKRIVDDKGVSWIEVPITKEQGKAPVEAFKIGNVGEVKFNRTKDEVQNKLNEIFGRNVPMEVVFNAKEQLGNANAIGAVIDRTVKLLEENNRLSDVVANHEGWHWFKQNVSNADLATINKAESDLFKQFPDRVAELKKIYKGRSDEYIAEELMADEFSRYYATGKTFSEKLKIFFDKLLQSLKLLFSKRGEVLKMFKNVKKTLKNTDGVSREVGPKFKEVNPVDRLIAEGKIRVVSRNNKDVYQVKKAGEWVNAQSEESAVMMVTRTPKPKVEPELPPKLQRQKDYIEIVKETIQQDPANDLMKYYDPKLGGLPEVGKNQREIGTQRKVSKWRLEGDSIATEAGFESSDQAREAVDNLVRRKKELRELEKDFRIEKTQALQKPEPVVPKPPTSSLPEKPIQTIETISGEGRSLEIIAEQARREANGIDSGDISSLPKIISDTVTPVNKKINLLDYIRTPDRVLKKIGFGNQARKLEEGYINYVKELPKNIDRITKILAKIPDPKGQLAVFRWLDGKAVTLGGKELEVAVEIKSWLQEWAQRLKLEKDEKISHYITHLFNDEIIEKEFPEELAKIITDKIPKETYDPFLQERMGALGYKEDLGAALDAYVKRATRKVHMDPALEEINAKAGSSLEFANIEASQFKFLQKYIEGVQMRPTWIDNLVDNTIKGAVGYKFGQRPLTRTLRVLRQMTYRGMLGLNPGSALRNISQGVNTFAVLGPKYTSLGYAKLFNPGAIKELEEEGILNSGFVQDRVLSATKKNLERFDKGLFVFFDTAEKINRGSAYFGAKAKYINRNKMMMDEIGGKIQDVEEEAKKYAREIVRKTQFSFSSIDTPVALQSDIVKTMTQFGTFSIKQAEFLVEMAKDKNFMGLLRYALAGMAFVYTVGQAFGMKKEELIPFYSNITKGEGPFGSMPSLKLPKELIKAGLNVPDKYGKERDLKTKAMDVAKSAIGLIPAGTQMKKTFEGISSIQDGGSFDKAGNLQFTQDVSIPGKAQAVLFGKYASNEAQTYFNKVEINKEKKANIKPVYDEVQKLKNDGNEAEAQAIVDELSDEDYETYKSYKQEQKTKQTLAGKKAILPTYLEVQDLIKEGKQAEAEEIVNALSDEQYEYYTLVKKQVEKDKKADDGTMPKYEDGEAQTEKGVVGTVFLYAKAIGADPVVAFNRIFTNQKIRRIDNGAIVVERMPFEKSTEVKKKRGSSGDMKLDHTIPLQLGGSNSENNLNLVENVLWESYTPVENYLGNKLRTDKISKKDAQRLIKDFKEGKISAEDVYNY